MTANWKIRQGDAFDVLDKMDDDSIQTVVTSPPYWGLRDYGDPDQLGLEPTPDQYVDNLVGLFDKVRNVLRPDGTVWLNIGDCYASPNNRQSGDDQIVAGDAHEEHGRRDASSVREDMDLDDKNLCFIPSRVARGLQQDGWYVRSRIVWLKSNPYPEPVTDRPSCSHEYIFLLAPSKDYFFDHRAIREPSVSGDGMRNRRDVWETSVSSYEGAHFAVMPPELVKPCIQAGTSSRGACQSCGAPYTRTDEQDWAPTCDCDTNEVRPCRVLDPFAGSGTTVMVADRLGREGVGIELSEEYAAMARKRIRDDMRDRLSPWEDDYPEESEDSESSDSVEFSSWFS